MQGSKFIDFLFSKIWILLVAVILCIIFESITSFDRFFQKPFYQDGEWLISSKWHNQYKWLCYTGVKVVIILIGITALFALIYTYLNRRNPSLKIWIKPSLLVIISLALIPFIISSLKLFMGVYGPKSLLPYGGEHEHIGFLAQIFTYGHVAGGRCFPAGHASGGFALMSLYFLPVKIKLRVPLFYTGLILGWLMGLYQMARGEHFISHTLTTMFMALLLISISYKLLKINNQLY